MGWIGQGHGVAWRGVMSCVQCEQVYADPHCFVQALASGEIPLRNSERIAVAKDIIDCELKDCDKAAFQNSWSGAGLYTFCWQCYGEKYTTQAIGAILRALLRRLPISARRGSAGRIRLRTQ